MPFRTGRNSKTWWITVPETGLHVLSRISASGPDLPLAGPLAKRGLPLPTGHRNALDCAAGTPAA